MDVYTSLFWHEKLHKMRGMAQDEVDKDMKMKTEYATTHMDNVL